MTDVEIQPCVCTGDYELQFMYNTSFTALKYVCFIDGLDTDRDSLLRD